MPLDRKLLPRSSVGAEPEASYRPKETKIWPASTRKKNLSRRLKTHAGLHICRRQSSTQKKYWIWTEKRKQQHGSGVGNLVHAAESRQGTSTGALCSHTKNSHEQIKERTQWNWLPTRIRGTEKWNQEHTGIGVGQNQDAATKTTLSGGKNWSTRENE
jgi:hypothetical protein